MGDYAASPIVEQLGFARADESDMPQRLTTIGQRLDHLDTQMQGLTCAATTAIGSLIVDQRDIKDRLTVLEKA